MPILRPGKPGETERAYQEGLLSLGYTLPRYGADGWIGNETLEATQDFCEEHGITFTGKSVPAKAYDEVMRLVREADPEGNEFIVDCRNSHPAKKRGRKRKWTDVTGITLHQTACRFLRADEADHGKIQRAIERVCGIGVHHVVLRNGTSVWSNGYEYRMPQAQRVFNKYDVGVEIDGYYEGILGDPSTFWTPASQPNRQPLDASEPQIASALETCRNIIYEVNAHGGEIKYIHAHRQTSRSRTSDPGELLWKRVALPIIEEFDLSDGGNGFFIPTKRSMVTPGHFTSGGPGRPIPRQWDPKRTHDYRDKIREPNEQE